MLTRRKWLAGYGASVACGLLTSPSLFAQHNSAGNFDTSGKTDSLQTDFYQPGERKLDERLGRLKTLNDYFPLEIHADSANMSHLAEWQKRAKQLKLQLRVALGLYPEPAKTELKAVIHGKIVRDGYTIEKVFFKSCEFKTGGHYVSGNLYRPAKQSEVKHPAVLFAHGHWDNGRFHVEPEENAKKMVERGEEADLDQARHFMQAIPISLAKLGFVVFQYDMIGYADSQTIQHTAKSGVPHPHGFADAQGELWLQSLMGLQALNSLRAVDFVASLPDVDAKRIGMTGASGGGTQTFITAALDERIACAFPAVMVSTGMQGGCVCENCSLLRVGTGNVEIAALIAPRPLAMSGAKDWTQEIMTKGYPELKKLYALFGKAENVDAKAWTQFPHNYNKPAREMMVRWMQRHLQGIEKSDYNEARFEPISVKELTVYDAKTPRPKDDLSAGDLRKEMTIASKECNLSVEEIRNGLQAICATAEPEKIVVRKGPIESKIEDLTIHKALLGRGEKENAVPTVGMFSKRFDGSQLLIWADQEGKANLFDQAGKLNKHARRFIDAGYAIVGVDLFGYGEAKPEKQEVNPNYAGYTFGYNRSMLANQVHDLLTVICFAKKMLKAKTVQMIGLGKASLAVLLANVISKNIDKAAIELGDFSFESIKTTSDSAMLPGALKFGDTKKYLELSKKNLLDGTMEKRIEFLSQT